MCEADGEVDKNFNLYVIKCGIIGMCMWPGRAASVFGLFPCAWSGGVCVVFWAMYGDGQVASVMCGGSGVGEAGRDGCGGWVLGPALLALQSGPMGGGIWLGQRGRGAVGGVLLAAGWCNED